jgi:TRAP-type mannitol/chloroaromatic compound transport system permease small subunit
MLCAGYTLLLNEHVRIDVLFAQCAHRTQAWIDVFGIVVFLLPMTVLIGVLAWPMFLESFRIQEMSTDAGGLVRWPVKLLIPVGFLLLAVQGVSELIKRIAFLMGRIPNAYSHTLEHEGEFFVFDELKRPNAMKQNGDS